MKRTKTIVIVLLVLVVCAWAFWYLKFAGHHLSYDAEAVPKDFWGVTFSKKYAEELGLDWREAYISTIDDLGVKYIRLPVYWDDVEKIKGTYNYTDYDWMLNEADSRGVSFIINLGRRLPRWPECHQPDWIKNLNREQVDAAHIAATKNAIDHFKGYEPIKFWQLENEYFFPWFGECPKANLDLIREEIAYLKSVDDRPLILTDSGELNSWRRAAKYSDILGTTMYRVVWNNYFGYFRAPWPAWFYQLKASGAGKKRSEMIVAELQAEPWPAAFQKVHTVPQDEWEKSFSVRQFYTNAELARRTGFTQAYLWGVEWWYWLKSQGDSSMWDTAKEIIHASHAE